ncbi:MAG: hypothetical protein K2X69_17735, partial [Silvanigrellaceae bacterium]|nr:hypothetical protein [Silvanigrellaceae bacterium]
TDIMAKVTDLKTNKKYDIRLNVYSFPNSSPSYHNKLNYTVIIDTTPLSYFNQFSISYDPTENKDLPNDTKLTGTLVINSLGWHIPSFKNINVHISIDNSAPTPKK